MRTPTTRRTFLKRLGGGAGLVLLGGARGLAAPCADGVLLDSLPFTGEGRGAVGRALGTGLDRRRAVDLSLLTPETLVTSTESFCIRTGAPRGLDPASWSVEVDGRVKAPRAWSIAELRALAAPQGLALIECSGNTDYRQFGLISVAEWIGVPLTALLEQVEPVGPRLGRR